jgi:nucleoside-diphosphate-sugar epimerase
MKIGVIGAAGFIGRSLVARFHAQGDTIIPVGRGDSIPSADVVVHLARTSPAETAAAFNDAGQRGARRFVYVSSIKVNGETSGRPFRPDDEPLPQDAYARSKLETELEVRRLSKALNVELVIVRPPLVYGPNVGGNFAAMARWVRRGIPVPLASASKNKRSLIGIDNLCDFLALCCGHPSAPGRTFLVCDGQDVSTADLLRLLGQAMQRPARLFPVPRVLFPNAVRRRLFESLQIDMAAARELTGWAPPLTLLAGLRVAVGSASRR